MNVAGRRTRGGVARAIAPRRPRLALSHASVPQVGLEPGLALSVQAASSNVIKDLKGLLERAASTKHSAESLQEVLASYEDQVVQVHEELLRVTKKMQRERLTVLTASAREGLRDEAAGGGGRVAAGDRRGQVGFDGGVEEAARERAGGLVDADGCIGGGAEGGEGDAKRVAERFEDAGIEIDTAAERLLEAYSENSSLVQQIEDLQCDLEKLTKYSESQERYYSSKIADLTWELREAQAAEDVRVRDVGERDGDRDRDRDRDRMRICWTRRCPVSRRGCTRSRTPSCPRNSTTTPRLGRPTGPGTRISWRPR
jgi:hypothetical protein